MEGSLFNRYRGYSWKHFRKDLLAGMIVGIISLPLAMSFAIASGVKPEYGIYTTIMAGVLISLLGGSRFQIGGPTGAFIPILLGIVLTYGYENLLLAGLLAGVILCLMGIFKLGSFIKYIPQPVIVGFTAGIAVIIFTGQIADFLGLTGMEKHEQFIANFAEIINHLSSVNLYSVTTAMICLGVMLLTTKLFPRVPGSLIGLVVSTAIAMLFFSGHVPTIGTVFGAIPSTLPSFHIPEITLERIQMLLVPAFVIAILGGIESLLSAVVADGMTHTKHNSNRELLGQGIANIVTPLIGGIPATGAIARTATNIKSGAVSPISGVTHGLFVLLTLLLLAPYTAHIPLASMAPILMVVAWNMSERKHFIRVLKTKTGDSLVLLVTFSLTIFTSLTTAVGIGLLLSILLFAKRMSGMLVMNKVLPDHSNNHEKVLPHVVNETHDCPQISIYTVEGPIFFGTAQLFEDSVMKAVCCKPKVFILRLRQVPFMDVTGEESFRLFLHSLQKQGSLLLVSGVIPSLKESLQKNGLVDEIGKEHFFDHTGRAIDYALEQIELNKCIGCKHFAFHECAKFSRRNENAS
ncbi:SulP family inorganic anion transporter [Thermoactinomyces sp. DSM 45892]|uniref:SulP family inorganic anion transporter n=1 Tax=Thermoactinomyces sp. DSM 45892 TaxID=1882753 RepID=UPI000897FAE1|nr:SulP family inorganic anion transporter [Thermoactinomyces sp. DSM 45892]SDY24493.1 sulfate permease, SulP family [Thermoactinomyces sp. DSM 45892]